MKKNYLILSLAIWGLFSCHTTQKANKVPRCVQENIQQYVDSQAPSEPRASVDLMMYKGEKVYVHHFQNFPDGMSFVKDEDCNTICEMGGIDGRNTCTDWENSKYIETVWQDPR